jgi:hypothetical protein
MSALSRCTLVKAAAAIPSFVATALIAFISYVFFFKFIPTEYEVNSFYKVALQFVFLWFSSMTFLSLWTILLSDPGYISHEYKEPLAQDGSAPLIKLRLHNYRMFKKYKLYDFSKQADEESGAGLIT